MAGRFPYTHKTFAIPLKINWIPFESRIFLNVPLSADDGQIERALRLEGWDIQGIFREKLRVDGFKTVKTALKNN